MATHGDIGLSQPAESTITLKLRSVTQDLNSTVVHQEVLTIGGAESSLELARVLGAAPASTDMGLVVRPVGYSTTVNVSSLAGAVIVRSSAANFVANVVNSTYGDLTVRAVQSTATDLLARVNQGVGNSSAADRWRVNVANSSAGDYVPVRIVNSSGDGYLPPGNEYSDGSTFSTFTGPTLTFNNSTNDTYRAVGLATPWPIQVTDSSNAAVKPGDSANNAVRVNVVAGAAGGSTLITVRQSTVGDLRAAVYQSTAADLNVTVAGYSTTVNVSSLAGAVIVRSSAANALMTVYQSTAADLAMTATLASSANSVLARVTTSSGGGVEGSTLTPSGGILGLHTRPVLPVLLSTTIVVTSTHSTAIYPLVSSAAGLRHKVYAYFVSSTHTNPSTLIFCSSASDQGFHHWHVGFGSGSSGMTGANLAVTPPGFIFAGIAQNALNVKVEGGSSVTSTVIVRVAVSYFSEA